MKKTIIAQKVKALLKLKLPVMKLEEMAELAIRILKESGANGIENNELAAKMNVQKRRVYDVIAILKAADAVTTVKENRNTRIYWVGDKRQETIGGVLNIRSNRIKVTTSGFFINVINNGGQVILESTSPTVVVHSL